MDKIKDIKLKWILNALIPKSKNDFKHLVICTIVYFMALYLTKHSGIALLATISVALFKELNDEFAFSPWLLKWLGTGKPTGFSGRDVWIGISISLILTILQYNNIINIL